MEAYTNHESSNTTMTWFTRIEIGGDELEDFAIVFEHDKQERKGPAAALPEEHAAGDVELLVIYDPQALQVPAAALQEERVAGDGESLVIYDPQALKVPTAAQPAGHAAGEAGEHGVPLSQRCQRSALPETRNVS